MSLLAEKDIVSVFEIQRALDTKVKVAGALWAIGALIDANLEARIDHDMECPCECEPVDQAGQTALRALKLSIETEARRKGLL